MYISKLVEDEIERAPAPRRTELLRALATVPVQVLPLTVEAGKLALAYLEAGVWTPRSRDDALHVATAVCHGLDVVVSWNLRDLANVRRVMRVNEVNARLGYRSIRIATPEEVIDG